MSLILLTGTITLDIINTVAHYPQEDEELRANSQRITVGGNATNTAIVLGGFNHVCEVVSTLAQDLAAAQVQTLLSELPITLKDCQICEGSTPTSYITLNQSNGSRTIVHYRDLPELSAEHFYKIPVERYDWLHFEGRNVEQLELMLKHARRHLVDQPISLEVEKARTGLEALIPRTDLVMFSRPYALSQGFSNAEAFLKAQQQQQYQAAQDKLKQARQVVKETDAKGSFGVQVALATDQKKAQEITQKTQSQDFARNRQIHNCWLITAA